MNSRPPQAARAIQSPPSGRRMAPARLFAALLIAPLSAQDPPQGVNLQIQGDDITLSVNENTGLPLIEFVKLAQQITRRTFTFSETDFTGNPNATVTFVGPMQLKRDSFFGFFQTMLYIKGFATVMRGGPDSEIVQIVNMQGPSRNEIQSSAVFVAPERIAEYASQTGVTILTSVPLEHINAQTATTALRPFFSSSGAGPQGLIPGNVGNNRALLLQGFGPQVYAAFQLLRLVDLPEQLPDTQYRMVRLINATAEELEPILKQVLEERTRRIQQAAGPTGGQITGAQTQDLQVLALSSLNALLLSGDPARITEALDLIAQLDVPVESGSGDLNVIQLRNVLADDLEDTLRNFIREDLQAQQQAQTGQPGAGATGRRPRQTVIVAHPESNSLLISATQTNFKQLERMIDQLDERQPQVLIEAALVELRTDDLDRLGVELGYLDIGSGDFTRPFGFTTFGLSNFEDTDDDGLPDTRLPDFANPLQGVTGGIISSDDFAIPILINALQTDNRANILSLPSVVVNNNESALVKSEEDRPTEEVSQGNATTTTGIGQSRKAGIELSISPSISSEDYLRLNIDLSVSRFLTAADPTTAGPIIMRQVRTQITLPSGHTMILGGIIEDIENEEESGVPLLKDIPLLGWLFRSKTSEAVKTNLYFFVTPTILDEDDFSDLSEITQKKKLEASEYIGHRRMRIVDPRWTGTNRNTLEDSGATIEDLDRMGGFDIPYYQRPKSEPTLDGKLPTGPLIPDDPAKNTNPTDPGKQPPDGAPK